VPDFKTEHAVNIPVPGSWEKEDRKKESQIGSGTYRVKILLPSSEKKTYGILFSNIITSADFFINGEKEYSFNSTSTGSAALPQKRGEHFFFFESEESTVDLVIHVSNQENPFFGGLTGTLKFGEYKTILKERNLSFFLQSFVIAVYSLHFLYVLVIYFAQKKTKT